MRQQTLRAGLAMMFLLVAVAGCSRRPSDAQLASEVQNKINGDPNLSEKLITVSANGGIVTLTGRTATDLERTTAANDAAQIEGVKSVINDLEVEPQTSDTGRASGPGEGHFVPTARTMRSSARSARAGGSVVIPEGTIISIRMVDGIDSGRNQTGDTFRATLEKPIALDNRVIFPRYADVEGRVADVASAGHFTGRSDVALVLTKLTANGKSYELRTDEFVREGSSRGKRTAETVGGGAGVGALIGAIAGGGKGAAIGAGAGAATGTAVQAVTKGQQVVIPSETVLDFQLKAPVVNP
jgi:hypothetical protein